MAKISNQSQQMDTLLAESNARAERAEAQAKRLAQQLENIQTLEPSSSMGTPMPLVVDRKGKGREDPLQNDPYDGGDETDSDDSDEVKPYYLCYMSSFLELLNI